MAIWETFVCLVGAVAALVRGVKELFFRHETKPVPVRFEGVQSVCLVLPGTVTTADFVLDEELRDLLKVSRSGSDSTKPKLWIAGESLASVPDFVGAAQEQQLFEAEREYECSVCGKPRKKGNFVAGRWHCAYHLHQFWEGLASGKARLEAPIAANSTRGWEDFRNLWESQPGASAISAIRSDPLLQRLGIFSNVPGALTASCVGQVFGLSGSEGSFRMFCVRVPRGVEALVVKTEGDGDADLYLRRGEEPTTALGTYDSCSRNVSSNECCEVSTPHSGKWYIMLFGSKAYRNVSLSVHFGKYDRRALLEIGSSPRTRPERHYVEKCAECQKRWMPASSLDPAVCIHCAPRRDSGAAGSKFDMEKLSLCCQLRQGKEDAALWERA